MAIDTRDRRASAAAWRAPWRWLAPNPDGSTPSRADRQQLAAAYRGIPDDATATARTAYPDPFAATVAARLDPFSAASRLLGS